MFPVVVNTLLLAFQLFGFHVFRRLDLDDLIAMLSPYVQPTTEIQWVLYRQLHAHNQLYPFG